MNIGRQIKQLFLIAAIAILSVSCSRVPSISSNPWQPIELPTEATFADIAFVDGTDHGWLVGTKATLFETTDGGNTWQQKQINLGDEKVSFNAVSFQSEEGWIVGEPSILLHTEDGGKTWSRIALSAKLPGAPEGIVALEAKTAEMITDLGAIYKTTDGGKTWKALVEGAVGVARNIDRSEDGQYVAVSANGNFFSTWAPGDTEWTPHQRTSSRRVQNMGFTGDGRLWLIARGGQIQFSEPGNFEEWQDPQYPEPSTSWGFLDAGYQRGSELWIVGGSGNILYSPDDGQTWYKDRDIESVPSNLYKVVFLEEDQGFVLGQRGILLKYQSASEAA